MRSGPGAARTILLFHIISARPSKQPLMVCTFLKVYMELGSYFLFLQEQIKDIIIIKHKLTLTHPHTHTLINTHKHTKAHTYTHPTPICPNATSLRLHLSKPETLTPISLMLNPLIIIFRNTYTHTHTHTREIPRRQIRRQILTQQCDCSCTRAKSLP